MLYYLHLLSEEFGPLNVFRYVTFRAVGAAFTAFMLSLLFGNYVIRQLISLKIGQPVRTKEEVHRLAELHGAKAGTPTMGGVLILGSVLVSTVLWGQSSNPFIWVCLFVMVALGGLGFADDFAKVAKKKSDGVSGKTKLAVQFVVALALTLFFLNAPEVSKISQEIYLPFFKEPILSGLGLLTFVFFALIIMGASNAVNLTDGLDGLAIGCTINAALAYGVLTYAAGNAVVAEYLQIPHIVWNAELTIFCMAWVGAGLGFLWFNCHPAKVFMGDTGSLAIGGSLGAVAICCKQELLLVLVGGVFVLEALSVILQVLSFKLTGKRIFRMSPIHHHFELIGWKENTVIVRFWILSAVFAGIALTTLKLR